MNPDLPNLFLVGVQKGGTTALAQFLAAHPEICLAQNKEAHVLDREDIGHWSAESMAESYAPHFAHHTGERWRLDATPIYLYYAPALEAIKRVQPEARLIVLLRDPLARAISHWRMEYARGNEARGALAAFALEPWRLWRERRSGQTLGPVRRVASYADRGRYRAQLARLEDGLDPEQVRVLRSETLRARHAETLGQIYDWLGLARQEIPLAAMFSGNRQQPVSAPARWLLQVRLAGERRSLAQQFPL